MKKADSAIERILSDDFEIVQDKEQNQPPFDFETDYRAIVARHGEALEKWKNMDGEEQKKYKKGFPDYVSQAKLVFSV